MAKFSAYTIAKNCSDKTDILAGIKEIQDYFDKTPSNKRTNTSYVRFYKLYEKLNKYK